MSDPAKDAELGAPRRAWGTCPYCEWWAGDADGMKTHVEGYCAKHPMRDVERALLTATLALTVLAQPAVSE